MRRKGKNEKRGGYGKGVGWGEEGSVL